MRDQIKNSKSDTVIVRALIPVLFPDIQLVSPKYG